MSRVSLSQPNLSPLALRSIEIQTELAKIFLKLEKEQRAEAKKNIAKSTSKPYCKMYSKKEKTGDIEKQAPKSKEFRHS